MTYDLVVKNGTVVTAEAVFLADVAITGEKIAAIGENLSGERELDARGMLVTPGAVDVHVHMSLVLPNATSSDDFFTGTRAALHGGTTTIVDFVHPEPRHISLMQAFEERKVEADAQVVGDYALHMAIGPDQIALLDELPKLVQSAGITTFKLYMAYGYALNDSELLRALVAIRDVGGLPVVHAENWPVITTLVAENLAAGRVEPRWHPRSRPALLEGEAAGRVIDLAAYVGVPLHIFHIGCVDVVQRVVAARAKGLPVYGETCPQYLFLTEDAYDAPGIEGALPVCAPPLRSEADRQAMWDALAHDDLQLVTTDHCPFTQAQKASGLGDFSQIPGGVPGIEMRFPALYTYGVSAGRFSLQRWVDLCCTTPARLHHLSTKGTVAPGYDADLVIFDPNMQITLSADCLHENVDWTPYEGVSLTGWPRTVLRRGAVVIDDQTFVGKAGNGRYIPRVVKS